MPSGAYPHVLQGWRVPILELRDGGDRGQNKEGFVHGPVRDRFPSTTPNDQSAPPFAAFPPKFLISSRIKMGVRAVEGGSAKFAWNDRAYNIYLTAYRALTDPGFYQGLERAFK